MPGKLRARPGYEARYTNGRIRPVRSGTETCGSDGVVIVHRGFALSNPNLETRCDPANRRDMAIHIEFTRDTVDMANGTRYSTGKEWADKSMAMGNAPLSTANFIRPGDVSGAVPATVIATALHEDSVGKDCGIAPRG